MSEEKKGHEDHPKKVQVTVDGKRKEVTPGTYVVSEFKEKVEVDATKELEQVVDGKLVPLADDAKITIHGVEVFVSHVRHGGAS